MSRVETRRACLRRLIQRLQYPACPTPHSRIFVRESAGEGTPKLWCSDLPGEAAVAAELSTIEAIDSGQHNLAEPTGMLRRQLNPVQAPNQVGLHIARPVAVGIQFEEGYGHLYRRPISG